MAEDTAVLEMPDTGIVEEQAPADEPETEALVDSPETDQAAEDGSETEPETLTREEAERLAEERAASKVAELKAQQDAEREEALAKYRSEDRARRIDQASKDRQGVALQSVTSIAAFVAKEVDEGRLTPADLQRGLNPKVLENIAVRLDAMAFEHINGAYEETYDGWLKQTYPSFAVPVDLAQRRERALAANNWEQIATTKLEIMRAAERASIRDEVRKEVEAELADKAKTDSTKATNDKAKRSGPTPVTGGAPPRRSLSDMTPGTAEYAKAYEAKYGFKP